MKNYTLLIIGILLLSVLFTDNVFSQGQNTTQGKDFWLSFGQNYTYDHTEPVLQVRIVASKAATVTFTFTESGASYSFNVAAGEVATRDLTLTEKNNVYNYNIISGTSNKSLRIQSTENISVFAIDLEKYTTDATNVLPITNYGKSYYQISYKNVNGLGDGYTIVATEDGTTISENGALKATLNRGQVFSQYIFGNDMTGRNITSNKPVAYFVTNSCVQVPHGQQACDCLFQQMAPTPSWGNNFMVPVTARGRERVRVVASQNGTTITQTGGIVQASPGTGTLTLNAGQFVEMEATLANKGCFITSNKPVAVTSYLTGLNYITNNGGAATGDPAMALVPPIEQLVSRVAIAPFVATGSSVLSEHHALIVTPAATKHLTTSGIGAGTPTGLTGGAWVDHPSGYSFYSMPLTNATATYFIENPNGVSVMGYGLGSYESYYYLAASSARQLNPAFYINEIHYQDADGQVYCDGPLNFRAVAQFPLRPTDFLRWYIDGVEQTAARDQMNWTLPAHSLSLNVPHTFRMDVFSSINDLYTLSTTFKVIDPQPPVISPAGPVNICPPATGIALSTSTGATWYQWYKNGTTITGATTNTYFATAAGSYTVETHYGACNPGPSAPVVVSFGTSASAAQISVDNKTICPGNTVVLTASSTGVTNPIYKWYTSQTSTTPVYTGPSFTTPAINTTTFYYVGVSGANFCENAINQRKVVTVTVGNSLVPGIITGSRGVCGSNPNPGAISGPASSGGSGPYTYQWQRSSDNINWINIGGETGLTYNPGSLTASTYYRRQTTDPRCGTVASNVHFISLAPDQMYWDIFSRNHNWNDPANWVNSLGQPLNTVPLACTDVHIPGNSNFYPSLDSATTIRNLRYGDPQCHDITFHFGAEVAKQHYLSYNKAYVRYNFGYYDGSTYKGDGDNLSAVAMKRGQWYALAAPLKKIVSGDFSVGGFPNMWQQGFRTTPEHHGDIVGEWYVPESNIALEVGPKQNYAISIWAGEYLPGVVGENDHTRLNAFKGVFEMPYFDNPSSCTNHRIYSRVGNQCIFKYYYDKAPGLPIENNKFDFIIRGNESYRFVIEDSNNKPQKDFKLTVPAGKEVLIGNVFLSSLDFHTFYARNSASIEDYYRLYMDNMWKTYSVTSGSMVLTKNIAAFQSFVVKTKGTPGTNIELYFPISASIARPNGLAHQLKSSNPDQMFKNVLYLKASNGEGETMAQLAVNTIHPDNHNVDQMFNRDTLYNGVPQLYTLDENSRKNTVQYEFGNEIETSLGISCDVTCVVELMIQNVENLNAKSLTLLDKKRKKEIDLFIQNNYKFTYDPAADTDRFVLRIGKVFAPTSIEGTESDNIKVYAANKVLYVTSASEIEEVNLTTVQGTSIFTERPGLKKYSKELSVPTGIYAVKVRLSGGEVKTVKIVVE